jgi:hypothetical protein
MLFEGTRPVDVTDLYLWCSSLALSGLFCSQDLQCGVSLIPHYSNRQYRKDILILASCSRDKICDSVVSHDILMSIDQNGKYD